MAEPIKVKSIDHATFVVKDLDTSREFYEGALGMEFVPRPNFSFHGAWYRAGETLIHLILEHDRSGPAGNRVEQPSRNSRTWHVAFSVDDAQASYERILELNIPVIDPPKSRPDGACQVFISDPDGHVIELCSE